MFVCDHAGSFGYLPIQAPPYSGKTSLLSLLQRHIAKEARQARVFYITLAVPGECDDIIARWSGKTLQGWAAGAQEQYT